MPAGLFARLTSRQDRGSALFASLVRIAREHGWYMEGEVPDTIDGRFAVLASVAALAIVRLEAGSAAGRAQSVALTERFVEAMDTEHRQLGIGDPTLGKTVRKLVGSLARRVGTWRDVVETADWSEAVLTSVYRGGIPSAAALAFSEARLRRLWADLNATNEDSIEQGMLE